MPEGKKKRPGRRSYLEHFHKDVSGQYRYEGPTCRYALQTPTRRRALTVLAVLSGGGLAAQLAAGFLPAPGVINCAWVLLPYAAAVVAAALSCWALGQLALGGDPLRQYVHDATVKKLPGRLTAAAVLAGLAALAQAVYMILYGLTALGAAVTALEAAGCAALAGARRYFRRLRWEQVP